MIAVFLLISQSFVIIDVRCGTICLWALATPGSLMTSAAADVTNHNGRKIDRFKPIGFCYARMTSAQSWSRRHHWFDPTSSLPIFKGLYLVFYKTLALIYLSGTAQNSVKNYIYAKILAEICMFTQQNRRCLNRPIFRPLWLMTSAAADVISVPGVFNRETYVTTAWYIFSYIKIFHMNTC